YISGRVIDYYTVNGAKQWPSIWFAFAAYALVLGIVFPFVFRYKHNPDAVDTRVVH
ncbi:MFS transporter, partial|nr:MFS transporter [Escherichia coli]